MTITILAERPDTEDSKKLIAELETFLAPFYPAESRHGYSVEKLLKQGVAFFVMRKDETPAGCGGVQIFSMEYGEVKRMFVRPQFRGLGLAKMMLNHLANYTKEKGVKVLRLETGIHRSDWVI
jgi:putative acetyltransferase